MQENRLGRTRLRLRRTLRITAAWMTVGAIAAMLEARVLEENGMTAALVPAIQQAIWRSFVAGLFGGGIYIFFLRDLLRRLPFVRAFVLMAGTVLFIVAAVQVLLPLPGGDLLPVAPGRLFSLSFLGRYLYWALLMGGTMLMVRLNDQYGSGGLDYLTGRYARPREEMRIFMFLDMRSSTAIAERIGHVRYFRLLNDVYADITDPVVYSGGTIYQYVGDEVSVTWRLRRGLKDQRCIRCFFDIKRKLASRARYYQDQYGLVPQFKAGFHFGEVTTGEVGLVKKEVIFSGDVVNTAARIQNSCNAYDVDVLVSKELLDILRLPEDVYMTRPIGEIPLKGKRQEVSLWTIGRISAEQPEHTAVQATA
ncbi:MAG: adenylate/guanylate cyclase domain-containing protein [Flavobacteriales bacterium]|nr:adenylate/guanylate cyclase domain-containing protein [Flavobacteriales bacterium]MCB9193917.1 adenylate/guanylate cyclase domain-containing protein [Flavobacteriales bacterium]